MRTEDLAAGLNAGIVHEHVDPAEMASDGLFQPLQIVGLRHIAGSDDAVLRSSELVVGLRQPVRISVGDTDLETDIEEFPSSGKTNTGGTPGDDGDIAGTQRFDTHRQFLLSVEDWAWSAAMIKQFLFDLFTARPDRRRRRSADSVP